MARGRAASGINTQSLPVKFRRTTQQQADSPGFDDDGGLTRRNVDYNSDKDSTEEELEKLVFGDAVGFMEGLKRHKDLGTWRSGREAEAEEEDGAGGLEAVDDNDLFFVDAPIADKTIIPTAEPTLSDQVEDEDNEDDHSRRDAPAWEDSGDDRLVISIATVPRLRRLRKHEGEDLISGREYVRRLRQQFEALNPRPDWARYASAHARKRKRSSGGSSVANAAGDDSEVEPGDLDKHSLLARPLAKLLKSAEALTGTVTDGHQRERKFRPEMIAIQRMNDIASSGPSTVNCLQIHPKLPFLVASGPDSTARIYHLRSQPPNSNPLLTSIHIRHTPLVTTSFHPSVSDPRIFLGGRRRYVHVWDLSSGRVEKISKIYGHQEEQRTMERFKLSPDGTHLALLGSAGKGVGVLNIINADTLQWVAQARINSLQGIADFSWWSDSAGLCVAGKNGEITEWSIYTRRVIARWKDQGAVGTTVLALGGDSGRHFLGGDRWVAVGSSAGIVNIYDRRAWATAHADENAKNLGIPTNPEPLKVLDNLVTSITHLHFTPDGQILCMASRWGPTALRLVHLPTCTVYKNWPTSVTPLGRVASVAWGKSEEGELVLAVGNENGRILAWDLRGS